jgi:hypothetical protein
VPIRGTPALDFHFAPARFREIVSGKFLMLAMP